MIVPSLFKRLPLVIYSLLLFLNTHCTDVISINTDDSVPSNNSSQSGPSHDEYEVRRQVIVTPKLFDGYLSNPGMGWQHDLDLVSSFYLPETVAYGNRLKLTWKDLNPAEGLYNWSPLDMQLSSAIADDKQFSFRIITMIGEIYGGHMVPDWVIEKGAVILQSGEPDYANCVYQQEWGNFVNMLIDRYDGNPNVAFVDVSGYGDFNEWSWIGQTEWDVLWEMMYRNGNAGSSTMETLDGQARRRLADMFIGGEFQGHQCRDQDNLVRTVNYSYPGFQQTQLLMPYAGVIQSIQYVFSQRTDVGFRYDCLGRDDDFVANGIDEVWRDAPVVYEFCSPKGFDLAIAQRDLQNTHGILVHNNGYDQSVQKLRQLMTGVGYRYYLKEAQFTNQIEPGGEFLISMTWQNMGSSPSYPKMGQNFQLHIYLLDEQDLNVMVDFQVDADISNWLPADPIGTAPPSYRVDAILHTSTLQPGDYLIKVAIVDKRTGSPIQLAFDEADQFGMYLLSSFRVLSMEK